MTKADDNAFVRVQYIEMGQGKYIEEVYGGLTKREYFAAMAMQGMAGSFTDLEYMSERAAKIADALITALNQDPPPSNVNPSTH